MMDVIGFCQGLDQFIDKFGSSITGQDSWGTMARDDIIMNEDCNALSISIFQSLGFDVLGEMIYGKYDVLFSRGSGIERSHDINSNLIERSGDFGDWFEGSTTRFLHSFLAGGA